ncbi:SCO family protein [Capnocytophaga sp. oral taxon 863]|uniref:SCO family protein n=1 Tax=Capnocytophaga sp. oral taxon 863 TaxID=1227265 RepID=UPI00054F3F38
MALGVLLLQGCKNNSTTSSADAKEAEQTHVETTAAQEQGEVTKATEISDISIYNLPETWTTQNGNDIQWKDFKGNVLVVVMIYTSCKAACPILIADMRDIRKTVDASDMPHKKKVKYILVSIDPKVDTPEHLKKFAQESGMDDDQWVFLRSDEEKTREFAAVLAVNYKQISPVDFSHSNIISVFNADGELAAQQEGLGIDRTSIVQEIRKQLEKVTE